MLLSGTILCLSDVNGQWLEHLEPTGHSMVDCQFYSYSCINSEYHSLFLSSGLEMCDGEMLDLSFDNGIIYQQGDCGIKHGLHVGDTHSSSQ